MSDDEPSKRFLSPEEVDQAVRAMMEILSEKPDLKVAILGGIALQIYGSSKPTTDVDFVGNWTLGPQKIFEVTGPLSSGGLAYVMENGIPVDLIVRNDAYQKLYEDALENSVDQGGVPVVTPEYLTAMKFAAGRPKDLAAVAWLLNQPGLVDAGKVSQIMFDTLGGEYARNSWEKALAKLTSSLKHFKKRPKK